MDWGCSWRSQLISVLTLLRLIPAWPPHQPSLWPLPPAVPAGRVLFWKWGRLAQSSARVVERWNQSCSGLGCRDGFLFPLIIQGSFEGRKMTSYPTPFPLPPFLFLLSSSSFCCTSCSRRFGDAVTKLCIFLRPYLQGTTRGSPSTFTGQREEKKERKKKKERDIIFYHFLCPNFSQWVWSASDGFAQLARTPWFCIFLEWTAEKKWVKILASSMLESKIWVLQLADRQLVRILLCVEQCWKVFLWCPTGNTGYRWGYRDVGFHHGEHRLVQGQDCSHQWLNHLVADELVWTYQ